MQLENITENCLNCFCSRVNVILKSFKLKFCVAG